MKTAPIHLEANSPERRRRSLVTLHCGGGCCCCCCCCCLHSVGSIIGATVAANRGRSAAAYAAWDYDEPATGISGAGAYWWSLLAVIALAFALGIFTGQVSGGLIALGAVIILLPGLQLIAALVAMLLLAMSGQADRAQQIGIVGRITLGTVAGGAIGLGIMILLGLLLFGSSSLRI